ncbi:UNVERIFIED_CONTAM: hypothetical protein Cloal_2779 [Acetivibrio alkalicellulosi]
MDEKTISDAVENVSIIKGVLEKTSSSFASFSKLFIYWGILFCLLFVTNLLITQFNLYNILPYFFFRHRILLDLFHHGIFIIVAFLIYRNVDKNKPLIGLEKILMKIWVLGLLLIFIYPDFVVKGVEIESVVVVSNASFFGLAIALIATSFFTNYKQFKYLGYALIGLSLLFSYTQISYSSNLLIEVLCALILPFTFLYTGLFLRSLQVRGS